MSLIVAGSYVNTTPPSGLLDSRRMIQSDRGWHQQKQPCRDPEGMAHTRFDSSKFLSGKSSPVGRAVQITWAVE
jgi:hypothetical protein